MKKFLSTLALALVSTMTLFAQTTLVATLTKGTETTSYYGIDAFKEAVEAAADGDLITLSPGTFNATTLNKSITIRGAGTLGENLSTHIIGEVSISTPAEENPNHRLAIYGIHFINNVVFPNGTTIKNLLMEKCTISTLNAQYAHLHSMTMTQCLVTREIEISGTSSVNCINCIISTPFNWAAGSAYLNFRNCIVLTAKSPGRQEGLHYFNSILVFNRLAEDGTGESIPLSCTLQKSIVTGKLVFPDILFDNLITHSGQYLPIEKVFKQVPATYNVYEPTNDYALTDSIATNILGEDGTQIGIYGGVAPYSQVVRYPRFTKFNVDAQASEEGKLKVEVEVAVGE